MIHVLYLVDPIAPGSPEFILNRIDREILKDTEDLFNEMGKFERNLKKNKYKKIFRKKKKIYKNWLLF